MRTISFRGKRLDNNEWAYGYYFVRLNAFCRKLMASIQIVLNNGNVLGHIEVNPDTVGQYIGVPDCKGKLIYEGDIVKDRNIGALGMVEYKNAQFVLNDIDDEIQEIRDWSSFEVVGNIYDNPNPNEWYKL